MNKNMKNVKGFNWIFGRYTKVCSVLLIMTMVVSMTGCSSRGNDSPSGASEALINAGMIEAAYADHSDEGEYTQIPENLKDTEKSIDDFAIQLFQKSITKGKSSMVSPVSAIMALAMVEKGADGQTLKQMEKAFGCEVDSMSKWLKAYSDILPNTDNTKINIANSLWFRDSTEFSPEEDFIKSAAYYFNAKAYKSAFDNGTVKDINKWCDEETFGMIDKIVEDLSPEDMAVIINAVAFDGQWLELYQPEDVRDEKFFKEDGSSQEVKLMYSREGYYLEDSKATGFTKPYKDGYSFAAILPKDGVSVESYVKSMTGESFSKLIEEGKNAQVNAVLPQFKSEYTVGNMVETLQNMGVTDLFSEAEADLSKMGKVEGGNLFVSGILQKTFIEVNDKGTKAAAVTAIKCGTTSAMLPEKIYNVRLDRPFIYAIIDDQTNTPMFIGTVMSI